MRPVDAKAHEARKSLLKSLEPGDLILVNGSLRIVRDATHKSSGNFGWITLSIMRCSWTRKPYTVKTWSDLYRVNLQVVAKGFGLGGSKLDELIQQDIMNKQSGKTVLECCDVIGNLI
ncbi:hypothetical protein [Xanthomonas phage Xp15]|uniref:Uncharacterized protein n=1 Tax=Xanthomonas phage Xp15 TaxID=322855 RepID=Q52PS1_9CAUD|nr:hypothetical protein XPXV15_gp51 [Xanthomonas phage Xp15]AAX84887.1 hypothetical protein [Xanthomonas phage Xp15]